MKRAARLLFHPVLVLTMAFAVLLHGDTRAQSQTTKELSARTKDRIAQMIRSHAKLDQIGARARFSRPSGAHDNSSSVNAAATAAVASGRHAADGIISIPHFDTTVFAAGQPFPLMFVGSPPVSHGKTTSVNNIIIPIAITVPLFDAAGNFTGNEVTFDGSSRVPNTVASPIFRPAHFAVGNQAGTTQWGDAMQRVTFFSSLTPDADAWHVQLEAPFIADTVATADFFDGFAIDFADGTPLFAFVPGEFIDGIVASYLATHTIKPDTLPIFATYNALLFYGGDPINGCCVLGYHDAIVTGTKGNDLVVQTFIFEDWNDTGIFSVPAIADVHALSHEVAEWLNDPFVNNVVPPYPNGETGCSTLLETGDQLVGHSVPVALNGFIYHPQTQNLLQWFTRETPSSALGGRYIFPNDPAVPNAPAPACQ